MHKEFIDLLSLYQGLNRSCWHTGSQLYLQLPNLEDISLEIYIPTEESPEKQIGGIHTLLQYLSEDEDQVVIVREWVKMTFRDQT